MTQNGHADKHAIIESDSTIVSGTDELEMTDGKPQPIKNVIQVDEAKLNEYPVWQRSLRRKQLEAQAKQKIEDEIRERERLAKMAREASELRTKLAEVGIEIPDTAEIDTDGDTAVINFGGYRWYQFSNQNGFGRVIRILKDVPDALRWDDMEQETFDYLIDTGYQDTVAEEVFTASADNIAYALDRLEELAESQQMKNGWVIAEMEQRKANPPVKAEDVAEPRQPILDDSPRPEGEGLGVRAQSLMDALKNPPKVEHHFICLPVDNDKERATLSKTLKKLTDENWFIEYEQFLYEAESRATFYYARLERMTDDTDPTGDDDPTATNEEEAEAEPDLSKFEAALLEIDDDELEAEPVGACYSAPEGEPITYHEGTIVADEPKTALDMLLEGKPISQAIFKYGLEATKQALNAAALSKVTGTPPTSLAELPEPEPVGACYSAPDYVTEEYAS